MKQLMRLLREPLFHFLIIDALNVSSWPRLCENPRTKKIVKTAKTIVCW
jgi:hypothetical protein